MNELKLVLNTKNVRKVACAAGIGWSIGRFIGGCAMKSVMGGVMVAMMKTIKPDKKDEEETKE